MTLSISLLLSLIVFLLVIGEFVGDIILRFVILVGQNVTAGVL